MKVLIVFILSVYSLSCQTNSKDRHKESGDEFPDGNIIARIDYQLSGCFGGEENKLTIVKSGGQIKATLVSLDSSQTTVLDDKKMHAYEKFIRELKDSDFGIGCTTSQYYLVKMGNERIEKTDDGCSWNGFYVLKRSLFKD